MKPNSVKHSSFIGTHDDVHATSIGRTGLKIGHTGISAIVGVSAWSFDRFKVKSLPGIEDADRRSFTGCDWTERNVVDAYRSKDPRGIINFFEKKCIYGIGLWRI